MEAPIDLSDQGITDIRFGPRHRGPLANSPNPQQKEQSATVQKEEESAE